MPLARNATIEVAGREILPDGVVRLDEHVGRLSRVAFTLSSASTEPIEALDRLAIEIETEDDTESTKFEFLVGNVDADFRRGEALRRTVYGFDPLALCDRQSAFRTHTGERDIGGIAADLFRSGLPGLTVSVKHGEARIASKWLFQAHETDSQFLRRLAAALGLVVFWNRKHIEFRAVGRPLSGSGQAIELQGESEPQTVRHRTVPPLVSRQVHWTDSSRRTSQSFCGRDGPQDPGATEQLAAVEQPSREAYLAAESRDRDRADIETWQLETVDPGIRLGDVVVWNKGKTRAAVVRVEHTIVPRGGYRNRVTAVPVGEWGVGLGASNATRRVGLLQGEVTANDDPNHQQRVRIILSEDANRRQTDWLPVASLSVGADRGTYWVPEVGDKVLVFSDPVCPELLVCIGAIRGEAEQGRDEWRHDRNARKALFLGSGLGITFDEERGSIKLETPEASVELEGSRVSIDAHQIELKSKATIEAKSDGVVKIDGTAIDLG